MIFVLLTLCVCAPSPDATEEYADRYVRLKKLVEKAVTESAEEEDFKTIQSEAKELLKSPLVNAPFGNHIKTYLQLMDKEAVFILSKEAEEKEQLLANINRLRKVLKKPKSSDGIYNEKKLSALINQVKKEMIDHSLLAYHIDMIKMTIDIFAENHKADPDDIDGFMKKYKKMLGDDSPELCLGRYIYLYYYERKREKDNLFKARKELMASIPESYPGGFGMTFQSDRMCLEYLVDQKDAMKDAFIFYKSLDIKQIAEVNASNASGRAAFFKICVKMFAGLNSDFSMMEMQENYISALRISNDGDLNDDIRKEAVTLRDMLIKRKEFREIRRIEFEYKLKPLPKQFGEE